MAVVEVALDLTKADAAQALLHLEGRPYSLRNYPMFVDIFNSPWPRVLMKSGRQVSKTITMAALMVTDASMVPHKPSLYANASGNQTSSFSTSKLDPFLLHSPAIYHNLMQAKNVLNNVLYKRFANWSELRLTYFSESADRVRGISGHHFYLDEIQDILYDAIIDAEECLSAASDPRFTYAGTSKTLTSTLEFFWTLSTQKSWVIKCEACGKWNLPSIENIQRKGLCCKKCGHLLNTFKGIWRSMREFDGKEPLFDGYHIPQIILPLHCNSPEKWAKLIEKMETYPSYKFNNEVLGLPEGEGDSPITEDMLRKACIPELRMETRLTEHNAAGATYFVAGIDWGGNGIEGTSRTTLSVYAVYPERVQSTKIYGQIFGPGDPTKHVEEISSALKRFGVHMAFGDHGGGNFAMAMLQNITPTVRIVPVMYTDQAAPYRWDEDAHRYTVNRTRLIDAFFMAMRTGEVHTMRWEDFQRFSPDILAVYQEIIGDNQGKGRRVWRRYPSKPDDILHSMVFGWFAARVMSGNMEF
ncbi:MAG: phage terminase large subunit family protein [Candidatus Cloacimonetes bacterium]|nr:phage terminase large subunit family protein [Candidatus Cloacimonadota bacterium]MDY0171614.1 phage terminase large subunit family protein [Candidatus Cloacimonadaceae bacterium]